MPKSLLESDFLTVDLRSIYNKQNNSQTTNKDTEQAKAAQAKVISDWGKEFKDRLAANSALSKEAQVSEYEIKDKFFTEYFNTNFRESAEQLLHMGQALRVALEKLGFNNKVNPILGFISVPFVQKNLISTNLLNANTFKAIYNAVAKKLVADTEFFEYRDYNIIYCPDLYRKSVKEIEEYLSLQKGNLSLSASSYSEEDQIKNKKIFFYIPYIKESDPNKRVAEINKLQADAQLPEANSAKLNELGLARALTGKQYISDSEDDAHAAEQDTTKFALKLQSKAEVFAALQFLSITTANERAIEALASDIFKELTPGEIAKASAAITARNIMPKNGLGKAESDELITNIFRRLQLIRLNNLK